jgi:hypothetical protein
MATDQQLNRVTPVELVDAIRSGRIRYPGPRFPSAADVARILDGIHPRYPQTSLLLWQDPADDMDSPMWLLDGGDLVSLREAVETSTDPERLASHGIDGAAADLLRGGDEEAFLARRAATLDRAVLDFWTAMVEPSARTRRPVALLFEDDDDGA